MNAPDSKPVKLYTYRKFSRHYELRSHLRSDLDGLGQLEANGLRKRDLPKDAVPWSYAVVSQFCKNTL